MRTTSGSLMNVSGIEVLLAACFGGVFLPYLEHIDQDGMLSDLFARNGTGKTSLLDGISWGTFGDRSGIDAAAMSRVGHTSSKVTVDLDGPGAD